MAKPLDPFHAISEPNRRRILDMTRAGDRTVTDLSAALKITQPAVSQHLAVLKSAGLVTVRREGRHRFYEADAGALEEVADWVAKYEEFWDDKLDGLSKHLAKKRN